MGLEVTTLAYIAMGTAAVGTAASIQQNRQSRKESRKARIAQQRISDRENQRAKLAQLRESQIARAQIVQSAATSGTSESSGAQGAVGAIGTQTAGNISFIQQVENLQQQSLRAQNKAADFAGNARAIGAATELAVKAIGMAPSSPTPTSNYKISSNTPKYP